MNNMKTYKLVFFILLFTGLLACRKDKPIPSPVSNNSECSVFDWGNQTVAMTWFTNERFQYQTPYFNPKNTNEFVYNYKDYELNEYKLMKYNLQTGVKTELANNVKIISQTKWSRKGWIAFDNVYNQNYQLWIVKENGDSLRQLTNSIYNLFPAWDSTGFNLYWQYSPVLGHPYYFLKKDLNSSTVDTVLRNGDANNGYVSLAEFSNSNKLIAKTHILNKNSIGLSTASFNFSNLIDLDTEFLNKLTGLTWSSDNETTYFTIHHNGLYNLNTYNSNYIKLMDFCDTKRYKSISCSPDGEKLIGERVDSYLAKDNKGNPTGQIVENSSIYIIDLETLEETKINLE